MNYVPHDIQVPILPTRPEVVRYPNFDFVRLVAASGVIFSHAFLIAEGDETREPFRHVLGPHNIAGGFSVHMFFIVSGFLVTRSLIADPSVLRYLLKRFLRIYPGLLCCACLVALIVAPLFSTVSLAEYFGEQRWLQYIGSTVLQATGLRTIETVSFYDDSNLIGEIVNGSLWTIPLEVSCYLMLGVIALVRMARPVPLMVLGLICTVTSYAGYGAPGDWLSNFIFVAPGFFIGAALAFNDWQENPGLRLVPLCLAGLVICALTHTLLWGFPILAAYPLLKLCTSRTTALPDTRSLGDITYGTYLYGWPMEQVVRGLLGDHATWWLVFLGALPLSYLCGFLSWRFIEKPALRLGKRKKASLPPEPFPGAATNTAVGPDLLRST